MPPTRLVSSPPSLARPRLASAASDPTQPHSDLLRRGGGGDPHPPASAPSPLQLIRHPSGSFVPSLPSSFFPSPQGPTAAEGAIHGPVDQLPRHRRERRQHHAGSRARLPRGSLPEPPPTGNDCPPLLRSRGRVATMMGVTNFEFWVLCRSGNQARDASGWSSRV